MDATFLRIIPIAVWAYGAILGLALWAGYLTVRHETRRRNLELYRFWDLCFYGLIAAVIGSRLFYILVAPEQFGRDPLALFKFWQGGLVYYGGFISALITALLYLRRKRMPVWKSMDILAPALALGLALWYGACFLTGYRYEQLIDYPWTTVFGNPDTVIIGGMALHPNQLLKVSASLGICGFVWRQRKGNRFDGELFWLFVLLDSLSRVLSDHFQGSGSGWMTGGKAFLVSRLLGEGMIAAAVLMLISLGRRASSRYSPETGELAARRGSEPDKPRDGQGM